MGMSKNLHIYSDIDETCRDLVLQPRLASCDFYSDRDLYSLLM